MKKRAALAVLLIGAFVVSVFAIRNFWGSHESDVPVGINASNGTETPAPPSDSTSAKPAADAAPSQQAAPTVASILATRSTLGAGMAEALLVFGRTDQNLISAAREAAITCEHLPKAGSDAEQSEGAFASSGDPVRSAAIDKLQVWCKDFDSARFLSNLDQSKIENPLDSLIKGGPTAQLDSARRVIRNSRDGFALNQAGQVLIEKDEMPLTTIFGGRPKQGKSELIANWYLATSFANCGMQLGCGPSSPSTLRYCAQYGCPQGADYQTALKSTLPPRDYQDVLDFSSWINSR